MVTVNIASAIKSGEISHCRMVLIAAGNLVWKVASVPCGIHNYRFLGTAIYFLEISGTFQSWK
jgi:hypothetical protein